MDDTRNVAQDCQTNVDEEIAAASSLHEDSDRREDDGKDKLEDVAEGKSHGWLICSGARRRWWWML